MVEELGPELRSPALGGYVLLLGQCAPLFGSLGIGISVRRTHTPMVLPCLCLSSYPWQKVAREGDPSEPAGLFHWMLRGSSSDRYPGPGMLGLEDSLRFLQAREFGLRANPTVAQIMRWACPSPFIYLPLIKQTERFRWKEEIVILGFLVSPAVFFLGMC